MQAHRYVHTTAATRRPLGLAVRAAAWVGGLAAAGPAFAHSPIEGLSSFYGGVLHPMLVPAHLVVLLALGLLLGGQAERATRLGAAAFLLALVAGLGLLAAGVGLSAAAGLMVAAAVLGVMVAARLQLPGPLLALLAAALGLALALDSDPELADTNERWLALTGTGLGAVLVAAAGMAVAEYGSRRAWQAIAVRVLGSWIAASAVMVSALALLGPLPRAVPAAEPVPTASAAPAALTALPSPAGTPP